jgi:hypothetical protein
MPTNINSLSITSDIIFQNQGATLDPPFEGQIKIYAKSDNKLYFRAGPNGAETTLSVNTADSFNWSGTNTFTNTSTVNFNGYVNVYGGIFNYTSNYNLTNGYGFNIGGLQKNTASVYGVVSLWGVTSNTWFMPTTNVTNVASISATNYFTPAYTRVITNAIGYYADLRADLSDGGSVTNLYGLYIAPMSTATNNYSAYFGNSVGIGTANPGTLLHISSADTQTELTIESTVAASRSTLKLLTNGNDWEIGARGSSLAPNNAFYIYDLTTGAYRTVIDSSGNVGIGTTTPAEKLHINGNVLLDNQNGYYIKNNAGTTCRVGAVDSVNQLLFGDGLTTSMYFTAGSNIYFNAGGAYRGNINGTNGYWRIGDSTAASYALEVSGEGRFSSNIRVAGVTVDMDAVSNANIVLGNVGDGSGWSAQGIGMTGGSVGNVATIGSAGGIVYFGMQNGSTVDSLTTYMYHAGSTRYTVFNAGNVGIGTTAPGYKLDVSGDIRVSVGLYWAATDKKLYVPTDGCLEWFTHNSASEHSFAVSHQGAKKVVLNTNGDSYFIGGNVGIGTNAPAQKLDIAGTLRLNGTTVGTNYTQIQSAPTPSSNVTYTLPASAPTAGQYLQSDASGNLTWATISTASLAPNYARSFLLMGA